MLRSKISALLRLIWLKFPPTGRRLYSNVSSTEKLHSMSEVLIYVLFNKPSLFIAQPLTLNNKVKYKKSCDGLIITCFHEKRIPNLQAFCFFVLLFFSSKQSDVRKVSLISDGIFNLVPSSKRCAKSLPQLFHFS